MPKKKVGLRVKYCENIATYTQARGGYTIKETARDGWYIQTNYVGRWYAIMGLRFARERDAIRAAQALTAAGLDCHGALAKADPVMVLAVACEFLQW